MKCSGEMFPGEEESTGSQIQAGNLCLERLRLRALNTVLMECRNKSLWGRGYGTEMIHNFSIKPSWLPAVCYPWNLSCQSDQSRCVAVPYVVLGGNFSLPFFWLLQNPDRNIPSCPQVEFGKIGGIG